MKKHTIIIDDPITHPAWTPHWGRWHVYLWEHTKYRGITFPHTLRLVDKEPDLYAVFCAIERMRR